MLDLGATTFWEDLNYSDLKKAGRIDEIVPSGKYDIHSMGGGFCYKGLSIVSVMDGHQVPQLGCHDMYWVSSRSKQDVRK